MTPPGDRAGPARKDPAGEDSPAVRGGDGSVVVGGQVSHSVIGDHSSYSSSRHYHLHGGSTLVFGALFLAALALRPTSGGPAVRAAGIIVVAVLALATVVTLMKRRPGPGQPLADGAPDSGHWLAALRRAERERVEKDLRLRNIGVSTIAVPWQHLQGPLHAAEPGRGPGSAADRDVTGLIRVWQGNPVPRLVLSGSAGSGKSVALALLARELLGAGDDDEAGDDDGDRPVPVILALNGWDGRTPPYEWIAGQLADRYPGIVGAQSSVTAEELLRALSGDGRIVPFLDTFDEMAPQRRTAFVQALNHAADASGRYVLASRGEALDAAERHAGRFRGATVLRLLPLTAAHFRAFLDDFDEGTRWRPLLALMEAGAAPAPDAAFRTPLMQWLGLRVLVGDRDPRELADPAAFPTPQAVEEHLLSSLVEAVYGHPANAAPAVRRWSVRHAGRWLRFVAARADGDDHAFRWWLLHRGSQIRLSLVYGVLAAVVAGTCALVSPSAATGLAAGGLWGVVTGAGFAGGYTLQRASELERRQVHPSGFRTIAGFSTILSRAARMTPLLLGTAVAVSAVCGTLRPPGAGAPEPWWLLWARGCAVAVAGGLVGGVCAGTSLRRSVRLEAGTAPSEASSPAALLSRDLHATAGACLSFAVVVAAAAVAPWWLTAREVAPPAFVLSAVAAGAVSGPPLFTAWPVFRATHLVFALQGDLPVRYSAFLDSARSGGILREDGVIHRFRHELLRQALLEPGGAGAARPVQERIST
ncbi:hypothetical protein [Streptomyces sp. NRRL S-87]|uniref:hypothetical protein n=1 Tax=Streptomyces sp. NRRL S-87 TaxID=1463920 RepID=UPI0004C1FE65|nr:hypothetical protein [Streptomyces sp. NRRL S-87]